MDAMQRAERIAALRRLGVDAARRLPCASGHWFTMAAGTYVAGGSGTWRDVATEPLLRRQSYDIPSLLHS
jgi:hypothetical protein